MGEAGNDPAEHPDVMHITSVQEPRQFWWDRARPVDADVSPLRAVIFDVDALGYVDADGDIAPRAGLADLVLSLFVAGVWVGVVSPDRRDRVQPLVRQLVGDGLSETIVSADDLTRPGVDAELYRLALWELGITGGDALAIAGSDRGSWAAADGGLPVVAMDDGPGFAGFADVVAVLDDYDGLLVEGCRQLRTQWWVAGKRSELLASA